jgi:anchored repeat ABC transporter substrate-binding protein
MGRRRRFGAAVALVTAALALGGCAAVGVPSSTTDGRIRVVTTTGILRDVVQHVGASRVEVESLIPDNADPHTYEPTLRDVRSVVYADVAFTNYLLLEEHNVIKTLDANLRAGTPNISLAEDSVKYSAEIIPLVEDVSLDTVWLGLRARGTGAVHGATRASEVLISATEKTGPGDVYGYLTGTFGDTEVYFDSADGFDAADGYKDDTATVPVDAHTHMSWAFTEPGVYTLTLTASLRASDRSTPVPLGTQTFTFAVGVDPAKAGGPRATVLDEGHADLTVDLDRGELYALYDPTGGGEATQQELPASDVVIDVPNKALEEVPAGSQFSFLGRAGTPIYQLPQAVLGKHVHGEIDPHLWQNVRNVEAYAKAVRDTLIEVDPSRAVDYRANTEAYLAELDDLDGYIRTTIGRIPEARRQLVTTHDAFAYLADAYGLTVAGFVTPNPATEPSLADVRKLTRTIANLQVPAVFLEPNLAARSSTLVETAKREGVQVCPIYGDTFGPDATTYIDMMRFNADSLLKCLGTHGK